MIELNPHRRLARVIAFCSYILAGLVLLSGVFFTLGAATVDLSLLPFKEMTNQRLAIMIASMFAIIALMIALFGWRVQSLFGQRRRAEKLLGKSLVGCLRLGSLGCALWLFPSILTAIMTSTQIFKGQPVDLMGGFVGASGSVLAIILMMSIAGFISKYFTTPNAEDRKRAFQEYLDLVSPRLPALTDPETRAFVQEHTMEVLTKLDTTLKSNLLDYLSRSRLLTGETRISLRQADFRGVDLRAVDLPHADLREINLEQANLYGVLLFEANLYKANLTKADLSFANLQGANLQQADLTGAVLEQTNLLGANLVGAINSPHQLKQARLD